MSDGRGSGISPLMAGLVGFLAYRSGRRRGEQDADPHGHGAPARRGRRGDDARRGRWGGGSDGGPALRPVRLPDGREVLQVEASLFVREAGDTSTWRRVAVEGTAGAQQALRLTLDEVVGPGVDRAVDVPVVLMPVTDRRRAVVAIDAYATGGRIGNLPAFAVRAVGDALLATHLAQDRPCAVLSRVGPDGSGALAVEVLMPDTFVPDARGAADAPDAPPAGR